MIIAENRLGTSMLVAWLAVASFTAAQETPAPFGTVVEVKRILTEVRVVNHDGSPVLGLGPGDFRVKVGGKRAEVRSVLWIPSTAKAAEETAGVAADQPSSPLRPREPEGRLIVVLFQVDFAMHHSRAIGLVRMAPRASEFPATRWRSWSFPATSSFGLTSPMTTGRSPRC